MCVRFSGRVNTPNDSESRKTSLKTNTMTKTDLRHKLSQGHTVVKVIFKSKVGFAL